MVPEAERFRNWTSGRLHLLTTKASYEYFFVYQIMAIPVEIVHV